MKDDKSILGAGMGRRSFLKAAGATLAAPALASLPASVARADDVVNITFWAWTPGTDDAVAMFEKKYPNIKVNHQNVGQGGPHYQKLRDAIQAGTGLPDVTQMEFNSIPSFQALKALAAPFGQCLFCPTGGITAQTAPDWLALDPVLCVGGSWIVPKGADLAQVEALAREAAALAR